MAKPETPEATPYGFFPWSVTEIYEQRAKPHLSTNNAAQHSKRAYSLVVKSDPNSPQSGFLMSRLRKLLGGKQSESRRLISLLVRTNDFAEQT